MTATDGVVEDDNNTTGIAISGTISSTIMVTIQQHWKQV